MQRLVFIGYINVIIFYQIKKIRGWNNKYNYLAISRKGEPCYANIKSAANGFERTEQVF